MHKKVEAKREAIPVDFSSSREKHRKSRDPHEDVIRMQISILLRWVVVFEFSAEKFTNKLCNLSLFCPSGLLET